MPPVLNKFHLSRNSELAARRKAANVQINRLSGSRPRNDDAHLCLALLGVAERLSAHAPW